MIASQIMSNHPVTVSADDSVKYINEVMRTLGFHHLLVLDNKKLVGVISDRDLLREISPFIDKMAERPQDRATLERSAHQIMSRNLITVPHNALPIVIADAMIKNSISCVPVLDDFGHPIGIITCKDMLAAKYT